MPKFNDAFWRWFGRSKVVDRKGNPLVVYHWTDHNFSKFKVPKTGMIWFSDDPKVYAPIDIGPSFSDRQVYPVFLSLQNPLDLADAYSEYDLDDWKKILEEAGVDTSALLWDSALEHGIEYQFGYLVSNDDVCLNDDGNLAQTIQNNGFDGIRAPQEGWRESSRIWVAFSPLQIKSAIGNRGTWDPEDPDIRRNPETKATIRSGKTAIPRKDVPVPVRALLESGVLARHQRILDFGAGRGDSVRILRTMGFDVEGYDLDPDHGFPMPSGAFDVVYSTYVMNVIPDQGERIQAVDLALSKIRPGGVLFLFARNDVARTAREKGWPTYGDGWLSKPDQFQRNYTSDQLYALLEGFSQGRPVELPFKCTGFACAAAVKDG